MKLGYEEGINGYFDGNISSQTWKTAVDNLIRTYTFAYDGASRILSGAYSGGKAGENYSLENMTYDFNGNIKTLNRKGKIGVNNWGYIDQLSYDYQTNSNKIQAVNDAILLSNPNVGDFRDSSSIVTQYTYNQDGSLNSDDNKKITFEWNYLKKPKKITKANGQWEKFMYDASGNLLQTLTSTGKKIDFVGNLTYENDVLYQIAHDEGRITATGNYEYDILDHAGNLRVSFRDSLGIAKIVTKLDYDPWGFRLKGLDYYSNYQTFNRFKTFSGKQLHDDFGFNLLSYKFRFHDPAIGRFISIDPLAEEYSHNSTFAFAENKLGLGVEYEGLELVPYNLGDAVWRGAGFSHVPDQKENEAMAKKAAITTARVTAEVIGTAVAGEILGFIAAPLFEGTIAGRILSVSSEAKNLSKAASSIEKATVSEAKIVTETGVKQIGPIGDAGANVTKQVPKNWEIKTSKNDGGTKFIDPQNSKGNSVRVQRGNPNSPNPAQQKDYVKETRNGKVVDKNGNEVSGKSAESHIPREEFKYKKNQ